LRGVAPTTPSRARGVPPARRSSVCRRS
jgi:hypothetical protein